MAENVTLTAYLSLKAHLEAGISCIESALTLLKFAALANGDISVAFSDTSSLYTIQASNKDEPFLTCVVQADVYWNPKLAHMSVDHCCIGHLMQHCCNITDDLRRSFQFVISEKDPIEIKILAVSSGNVISEVHLKDWVCEICSSLIQTSIKLPSIEVCNTPYVAHALSDLSFNDWSKEKMSRLVASMQSESDVKIHFTRHVAVGATSLWPLCGQEADCKIVGVVNCTPDSFSDGGMLWSEAFDDLTSGTEETETQEITRKQISFAKDLITRGSHALDVGAESTRPGASEVAASVQIMRMKNLINHLAAKSPHLPLFIDTRCAQVFDWCALRHPGAGWNDVSGLRHDPDSLTTLARSNRTSIIMHSQGTPETMASLTDYRGDLVVEIAKNLGETINKMLRAGIYRWRIIADPGIGFAKTKEQNVEIIRRLEELRQLLPKGVPLMLGPSRKRFLRYINPSRDYELEEGMETNEDEHLWAELDERCIGLMRKHQVFKSICSIRVHNPSPYAAALQSTLKPSSHGSASGTLSVEQAVASEREVS